MVVVPADSRLEAEAMISNRDIGFVSAGQTAEVKIDTFNFTRYGLLHGTVVSVSQDEIEERIRNQAAHYNVSVEKMRKKIDEHEGINGLMEEILLGKTIDFLKANVSVEMVAATGKETVKIHE